MSAIDPAVASQIDAAFDYRGHVTVTLKDGKVIEGYIYHRNLDERFGEPCLEMFPKDKDERLVIAAQSVKSVALTGKDFAEAFVPPPKK
jgi:hypothetical protein